MKFTHLFLLGTTLAVATSSIAAIASGPKANAPKVTAKEAPTFPIPDCAHRGWCTVTLAGTQVLAIAEEGDKGASGLCMRGQREDLLRVAAALKTHPHDTRSGAVCIYTSATALPANPATRADGTM